LKIILTHFKTLGQKYEQKKQYFQAYHSYRQAIQCLSHPLFQQYQFDDKYVHKVIKLLTTFQRCFQNKQNHIIQLIQNNFPNQKPFQTQLQLQKQHDMDLICC